jgi:ABC-type sugar transport system ATPase subunit
MITVGGRETRMGTPRSARESGITLVPQDILMAPEMSIGRNILLGMEDRTAAVNSLNREERDKIEAALAASASSSISTPRPARLTFPSSDLRRSLGRSCRQAP